MKFVDLGNTKAKILNENNQLEIVETINIIEHISKDKDADYYVCSVVPKWDNKLSNLDNVTLVTNQDYKYMIENELSEIETKGVDRILADYAAIEKYGNDVVVIDIGSATTIDVITNKRYMRGCLYPGFNMLANALAYNIDQLPNAMLTSNQIDTASQIYHSNIYGFIGALKEMLKSLDFDSSYQVVITGGTVKQFAEDFKIDIVEQLGIDNIVYHPQLIFDGMKKLYKIKEAQ